MEITFIGAIQLVVGTAILLFGSLRSTFALLILSGIFSGSMVIAFPAVGASIPPYHFALVFIVLRILLPGGGYIGLVPEAVSENRWFVLFAAYGIACALIGPRLFAGEMNVYPMTYNEARSLFDTIPLVPTSQNLTHSVYLAGSLLAVLVSYIACRVPGAGRTLVTASLWVGWLHIVIGLVAVAARGTPFDAFLDLFRNGDATQFNNEIGGFVRIRGIFPEASAYAAFGLSYLILSAELWYRSIRPRATGWLAFAMAVTLFFSTSSTAYVGLAVYLAFFILRLAVFPRLANMGKAMQMAAALGGIFFVSAIVMALVPDITAAVFDLVEQMTVGKSDSDSGRQRLFWAMQGWWVFLQSYGLGIGVGSFRSSSMLTGMLGSTGLIGIATFAAFALRFFQPWKKSTWGGATAVGQAGEDRVLGAACASAAMLSLIPATISSAAAYPGIFFCVLAGAALALRPASEVIYVDGEDAPEAGRDFQPGEELGRIPAGARS